MLSKRINQNEQSLRTLFSTYSANDHKVLAVVDQPNNNGRLTVAVAPDIGIDVRYLPGLAVRQLSRIQAGNAKTDIRDAYTIAHAGKNLPESLRSVDRVEKAFCQLKVLNGVDDIPHTNPAIHARNRPESSSTNPHDRREFVCLSNTWTLGLICWAIASDTPVRHFNNVELAE